MITEEQKQHFEREGYLIFHNLFDLQDVGELTTRIDGLEEEHERELQKVGQHGISIARQISFTVHVAHKDPYIKQFVARKEFVEIANAVLGPDVKLCWDQAVYKRPEANRDFPWHQDNGYGTKDEERFITCWLALEDVTIENGCIWIQPGTHLNGLLEHKPTEVGLQGYFGDDPGIPVPLSKGSMVVFHTLLLHRSTPNLSNTIRKGYVIQYGRTSVPDIAQAPAGIVISENGQPILVEH